MPPATTSVRGAVGEGTVTPNRVWAIVSLLSQSDDGMEKSLVERAIMPDAGDPERNRATLANNLREAKGAGLIVEDEDWYRIAPDAPPSLVEPDAHPTLVLTDAMLLSPEGRNDALGYAISWFLDLDPYGPDAERQEAAVVGGMKNDQVDGITHVTNDHTYGALEGWAVGLGFTHHSPFDTGALIPDPTVQLRLRLPSLFAGDKDLAFAEATTRLARLVPVFEGGRFRKAIPSTRQAGHLSKSTSLAWMRLKQEGLIELTQPSDAETVVLVDADGFRPVSHVALLS
jgi:hypothetical protein